MKAIRYTLFAVLAAVLLGTPELHAEGMTLDDLHRTESVGEVRVSPDGSHIAFVRYVPRNPYEDENGPVWRELHIATAAGESRAYVAGEVTVSDIAWHPSGNRVSFLSKREGDEHTALYTIAVDGGEARRILSHETGIGGYSWHPDGDRVAFLATEAEPDERKTREEQGFNARVVEERLRPTRVWLARTDGDDEPRMLELEGSASELHFGPDGDYLAMMMAPTPLIDDHYMARAPQVVDAETGDVTVSFGTEGKLGKMAWSPNGERLAWIGAHDIHDPSEGRLVIGDVRSGSMRVIKDNSYHGHVRDIAWESNDSLIWLGHRGTGSELGRIRANGSSNELILPEPDVVLGGVSLSGDGAVMAFSADSPTHPNELFVMADGALERWTDSNPWLADRELAAQETVTWQARDGLELQGVLVRPLNDDGGDHPLIMAIHGGPEAHVSNGWVTNYSDLGQVAAARGFAVFYPNYRGSTGRGVRFSKMGQGDPAGAEFDDIVDAKNHLVETGLVDGDRVGITGGSYGGYASAWGATAQTEHFAASVMFVGISNTISKFGTSDIPRELKLVHARRWPWDDWELQLERSPIYHAEDTETPILIMHGEEDTRVHPSQSMELFRHLKVHDNVPVRLVTFPGEGHGNRNAASQREYAMRLIRWMEHFLVNGGTELPPVDVDHGDRI